jgi:hypothetical protein
VSEETIPQTAPPEDDVNTTPPNPPAKDGKGGWSMPEPVFRKTSGYLPQGFEKKFTPAELKSGREDSTAEMPAPNVSSAIDPQPDIHDTLDEGVVPAVAAPVPAPKKSSGVKIIFAILGILIALALVVVIIAVIYFLFFTPVPEAGGPLE